MLIHFTAPRVCNRTVAKLGISSSAVFCSLPVVSAVRNYVAQKVLFSNIIVMCVCVCVRERERERRKSTSQSNSSAEQIFNHINILSRYSWLLTTWIHQVMFLDTRWMFLRVYLLH